MRSYPVSYMHVGKVCEVIARGTRSLREKDRPKCVCVWET